MNTVLFETEERVSENQQEHSKSDARNINNQDESYKGYEN